MRTEVRALGAGQHVHVRGVVLQLSLVEEALSRQGYFSLFDWLLAHNHLLYADYEAWRYRRLDTLDGRFQFADEELDELIHAAQTHALSLGLSASPVDYFAWGDRREMLHLSDSDRRHQGLVSCWQRGLDIPQMDLFMDNSSLIAENALADVLAERNWDAAEEALQRLTRLNPGHRQLGTYVDLINYGRHMQANTALSPDVVELELESLQQRVSPLAKELLRTNAGDYLAFAWQRMADNLEGIGFDPEQPDLHLSYALTQIPDWQKLQQTLAVDPQLYLYPQLLERLVGCFTATGQHAGAGAFWCLLFDHFPEYAESAVENVRGQAVYSLWEEFCELYEGWQPALFASFVLISEPGLLHQQRAPLENRVNLATLELLQCRQAGENESDARRALQRLSPQMLSVYLNKQVDQTGHRIV